MNAYKHRRPGGRAGKMRLAHHILWEEKYGAIPEGYQIHHLDGDRSNNDLENLVALSVSDHQRMHSPHYFKYSGEWMRFCKECKELRDPGSSQHTLCNTCRARRERIRRRNDERPG